MSSTIRRFGPLAVALAVMPSCYLVCPYNPDQFFESQVRAECHFFFACCTAGEADVLAAVSGIPDLSNFRDEQHCVTERLEEGGGVNATARAFVQAEQGGRFKWNYEVAQRCLEGRINALNNCQADIVIGDEGPLEQPEECRAAPGVGLVKDGAPCFFEFECEIPGSLCLPPGVLEPADACEADDDCASGEECLDNVCVAEPDKVIIHDDRICIRPLEEGQDCTQDPDLPNLPSFCEPGTICLVDGEDATCQKPRQEDEDCLASRECDVGLFCDLTETPGSCTALKGEGDECNDDEECELGLDCDEGRATPTCEAPLPVDVLICNGIQGADDPDYDL